MAIILDSSIVVAAADTADLNHSAAVAWFGRVDEPLLVGALTLGDLDVVLQRELGQAASLAVVQSIVGGAIRLIAPVEADLVRGTELLGEARAVRSVSV